MDLTNIKPCVECASFRMGIKCSHFDELAASRMSRLLILGEDCFWENKEEVDDGQHT